MNATNVIRFSTQQSDWCNYLIQVKIGYPIRALSLIAIFGIELTMLSLCIERAIAVFAYRKYEKSTSKKLAYVMIIFQVISFLHCVYGLTSLVVLHGLLIINNVRLYRCKQKSSDIGTRALKLGEKYQLQIWSSLNQTAALIYTDFFYNILIFLPFAIFALMLSKFPHLRQELKFWRTYRTTTTQIAINSPIKKEQIQQAQGNEYFDYLKNQWSETSESALAMCVLQWEVI
ncbi:hypothetical protein Tcan_04431 [Toxocara canis]|uniref:Uncharacterized protein n=1 Tax=Toxocara canis TaxID=6265 RepID=A0A0B2VCS0_TOXCA|nr:hypothetical protein Tcan_04431 [Toxocara canis]